MDRYVSFGWRSWIAPVHFNRSSKPNLPHRRHVSCESGGTAEAVQPPEVDVFAEAPVRDPVRDPRTRHRSSGSADVKVEETDAEAKEADVKVDETDAKAKKDKEEADTKAKATRDKVEETATKFQKVEVASRRPTPPTQPPTDEDLQAAGLLMRPDGLTACCIPMCLNPASHQCSMEPKRCGAHCLLGKTGGCQRHAERDHMLATTTRRERAGRKPGGVFHRR